MTLADFERSPRANEPPDFHLRRMELLLEAVANPHLATPTIHIAGSKGKGSTAAMIAAALGAHGLRVGLYTSPHLHYVRERIRVGGEPVSERCFAMLLSELWPHAAAVERRGDCGQVSVFEILTAMAFFHFRAINADFQVIEVGLGGRLDATNLVKPVVTVVTPVGLDHVAVLGDTVAQIACEKAGIIKPGVPVVMGPQPGAARRVIVETASRRGADLHDALAEISRCDTAPPRAPSATQSVTLAGSLGQYDLELPLLGPHQVDNARVAVSTLEVLHRTGVDIDPAAVALGMRSVEWPARVQVLSFDHPIIVVDGAHNADAASALVRTLRNLFPQRRRVILIFGGSGGHDFAATARQLASLDPILIATRSRHPKAVPAEKVARALIGDNVPIAAVTQNSKDALAAATAQAAPGDIIVATGSLFVAAEIIEEVQGILPEYYPTLKGGHASFSVGADAAAAASRPCSPASGGLRSP